MKTTAKITAMLLVLALVGSTSARVITVEVEGVVNSVSNDGGFALDGSVVVGSTMTGYCTYDSETPDLNPNVVNGSYALISISMTIGNYTIAHDPMSPDLARFLVFTVDAGYSAGSGNPRFDGTIYVDGSPQTYDDITWGYTELGPMTLFTSSSEYITTDALPDLDSWPDFSIFDGPKFFSTRFYDNGDGYFGIFGEITSLTVIPEPPKTYYVNAAEGSDDNDGLSPQTPFATIQKAIDLAFDGDTVLVADGTYTGPGNRDIDFLGKAITVRSQSGPENCIIDCNAGRWDQHRGFYFHSGEQENSVVDGFTIINGHVGQGGGIACRGYSSPTITNCIITNNTAGRDCGGGGIFCDYGSNPTISNCNISSNTAREWGGAVYCRNSSPTIINCTISGNKGRREGGGICCWCGSPTITNCIISGNSAEWSGGGIFCYGSNPTIINCTITSNFAESYGGAIYCTGSSPTISNCTITGNSASNGNALDCDSWSQQYPSDVQLVNCILWDGGNEVWNNDGSTITITYSDIQDGYEGEGNIDSDPCFVEPGYWDANDTPDDVNDDFWVEGDYYLLPDSPCIDTGDPNYVAEPNETDIDGNPRLINGRIDMGAHETNYIQAAMKLAPQMLNCNSKGKYVKAHITLPEGFLPEDVDVNEPAWAEPMGAESESIRVFSNNEGPVKLEIIFDREAFCYLLTDDDSLEVTVIGSLTAGRYFYATDTIKIKPQHQRITYRYKKNQYNP